MHGYLRKQPWCTQNVIEDIGGAEYLINLMEFHIQRRLDDGLPMNKASRDAINEIINEFRSTYDVVHYRSARHSAGNNNSIEELSVWEDSGKDVGLGTEPADPTADAVLAGDDDEAERKRAMLAAAKDSMTDEQWQSLIVHCDGHSLTEGAEMLGISRAAHKSRVQKGRIRARKAWDARS